MEARADENGSCALIVCLEGKSGSIIQQRIFDCPDDVCIIRMRMIQTHPAAVFVGLDNIPDFGSAEAVMRKVVVCFAGAELW